MNHLSFFNVNLQSAVAHLNIEYVSGRAVNYVAFSTSAVGVRPTSVTVNTIG
jgi:hypothetical protein